MGGWTKRGLFFGRIGMTAKISVGEGRAAKRIKCKVCGD